MQRPRAAIVHRLFSGILPLTMAYLVCLGPLAAEPVESEPTEETARVGEIIALDPDVPEPWESTSPRGNPFDPQLPQKAPEFEGPGRDPLEGLAPIPPVPGIGPRAEQSFQDFLDATRLLGVMTLNGIPVAMLDVNGQQVAIKAGDVLKVEKLLIGVVTVELDTVVVAVDEPELTGLLTLSDAAGLLVNRSEKSLVIISTSPD